MRQLKQNMQVAGFLLALVMYAWQAEGQSVHFSQFKNAPLQLNLALTGFFDHDLRFTLNYRNQMGNLSPYKTFAGSAEMKVLKNITGDDIMGVGVNLFRDVAGDLNLGTQQAGLSFAYTKLLNKSPEHYISVGFQGGMIERSIDVSEARTNAQYGDSGFDPTLNPGITVQGEHYRFFDFATGIFWFTKLNDMISFYGGGALFHINNSTKEFIPGAESGYPSKLNIHGGFRGSINENISIVPSFALFYQDPQHEGLIGSHIVYAFISRSKPVTELSAGLFYRLGRSLIWKFKIDYNNVAVGFSYDANMHEIHNSLGLGAGPELSLAFTPKIPRMKPDRGMLKCPDM